MKKIKDQTQKKNLYYAIGVLVLVLAYVLGFRNLQKVNEEQETRVSELESQNAACLEMKKKQSENEEAIQQVTEKASDAGNFPGLKIGDITKDNDNASNW